MIQLIKNWGLLSLILIYFTWVWFTCIIRLQEVRDKGLISLKNNPVLFVFGYVTLFVGLFLDVALNVIFCTIIGLEIPQEALTTARLCRWYNSTETDKLSVWRKKCAVFFGDTLLNPIDPSGKHIK